MAVERIKGDTVRPIRAAFPFPLPRGRGEIRVGGASQKDGASSVFTDVGQGLHWMPCAWVSTVGFRNRD